MNRPAIPGQPTEHVNDKETPTVTAPARFIDIHVLQSVPFANLNRDDANAIKTVQYGNALRTRVSSQCWKRATRTDFQQRIGQAALRTRRFGEGVARELKRRGWPADFADRAGAHVAVASGFKFELATQRDEAGKRRAIPNKVLTNVLVYTPDTAVAELANLAEQHRDKLEGAKDITASKDKSVLPSAPVKNVLGSRNGVIHLFGRMLAEIDGATVDGAVQVAHALTTHATDVEVDYFSVVDDFTADWDDETGSGHMGHAEYSAGTFYRYATVDVRALTDNVGDDPRAVRDLVGAFLASFIESLPRAKKNATAPHTIPDLVHIAVRSDRPLSYAAAFEEPVRAASTGGFSANSARQMADYAQAVNTLLGAGRVLSAGWAGLRAEELKGLGQRHVSFEELIAAALRSALPQDDHGAAA